MINGASTLSEKNFFSGWDGTSRSFSCDGSSSSSLNGTSNPWNTENDDQMIVDKKAVESCYEWLDKVVRLCQQPRLNLKNSPPYLLDIIPDIYEKLQMIVNHYENNYDVLSQLEYFRIYVHSLIGKCKLISKVFKQADDKIFDVHSYARFRLTKLSLVLSHMLKDLEAIFPNGHFCSGFRITKPDAARWWATNFGNRVIVAWYAFQTALLRSFRVDSDSQLLALRNTIDLTCSKYVSIFEFDVFTRLFQPWSNILETWKALAVLHPGYMAFMTYDGVKAVLKQLRSDPGAGTYVFRLSCTKLGQWAIGYVTEDLRILQTIIQNKSLAQALLDGEREGFYLYPNGKRNTSKLLYQLVHNLPKVRLQVTQEQYELYCKMGSTFELCKICDENNKNIQLEPCGHLICKHCLLNCQSAGHSQTCPFCRFEIKGTEDVIIDPYRPAIDEVHQSFNVLSSNADEWQVNPDVLDQLNTESLCPDFGHHTSPIKVLSYPGALTVVDFNSQSVSNYLPPIPPRNFCTLSIASSDNNKSESLPTCSQEPREASSASTMFPVNTHSKLVSCTKTLDTCSHNADGFCVGNLTYECATIPPGVADRPPSTLLDRCRPRSLQSLPNTSYEQPVLNYAELELTNSDSDADAMEQCSISSPTTLTVCHKDKNGSLQHVPPMAIVYRGKSNTLNCLPQNPDPSILSARTRRSLHLEPRVDHATEELSAEDISQNVIQLLRLHPDMNEEVAKLLLSITHNQSRMASEIWTYFMPRPPYSPQ